MVEWWVLFKWLLFFVLYGSWNGLLIIPHFFNNIYFVFLFYFLSVINWFTKGCVAVNFCWLVPAPSLCLWYILGFFWSRAPARSLFLRWFWTSIAFPAVKFRRSSLLPVRIVGSYLFWQLRKLGKSCENKKMLNLTKNYFRVPNKKEVNSILFGLFLPSTCFYSELHFH